MTDPNATNDAARRVQRVAHMLLADGYLTCEVDAVLTAIQLISAAEQYAPDPAGRRVREGQPDTSTQAG